MKNDTEIKLGVSLGVATNVPRYGVIHCSDVSYRLNGNQFDSINTYHRDVREFPKSSLGNWVGYHDLFTGGKYYKCKEEWEVGAHCNQGFDGTTVYPPGTPGKLSMNYQSIGLCIAFDGDIEMPPLIEQGLLQKRLWELQDKYPGIVFFFHRKFSTDKTCPGGLMTQSWLLDLLKRPTPVVVAPKPPESMCTAQEATIVEQKKQIGRLQELVQSLIAWFNRT